MQNDGNKAAVQITDEPPRPRWKCPYCNTEIRRPVDHSINCPVLLARKQPSDPVGVHTFGLSG